MDKQNLMPHQAQPITRITTGQLPSELAELSEEQLQGAELGSEVIPSVPIPCPFCSFDGDDAE